MKRPFIRMSGCAKRYKQPQEKQYDNQDDVPFHKLLVNSDDRIILRLGSGEINVPHLACLLTQLLRCINDYID